MKLLTVRLESGFLRELRLATVAHETTMAEVVRAALADWLKRNPAPGMTPRAEEPKKSKKGKK